MNALWVCGWPSILVVIGVITALPISLTALALAVKRKGTAKVMALIGISVSFAPMGCGAAGEVLGRWNTDRVVATVAEESTGQVRDAGYAEAAECGTVGTWGGGGPMAIAALAIGIAFVRPAKPRVQPEPPDAA